LVVSLVVDGIEARLLDARVMMVPSPTFQGKEGEQIVRIQGLRDGQPVSQSSIADQRIDAVHENGLELVETRELVGILPLPEAFDTIEILVPGADAPVVAEVGQAIEEFCSQNARYPFCVEAQ
jgi:hypothetical protein